MIIVLPWPSAKLSPNARLHWRARIGPKQDAKRIALLERKLMDAHAKGFDRGVAFQQKKQRSERARIRTLEIALDAFKSDGDLVDARVLRYKAIASKAINEQYEIRQDYEERIKELRSAIKPIVDQYSKPPWIITPAMMKSLYKAFMGIK